MFIQVSDLTEFIAIPNDFPTKRWANHYRNWVETVAYNQYKPFYNPIKQWIRPVDIMPADGLAVGTLSFPENAPEPICEVIAETNSLEYDSNAFRVKELESFMYNNLRPIASVWVALQIISEGGLNFTQNSLTTAQQSGGRASDMQERTMLSGNMQSVLVGYEKAFLQKLKDRNFLLDGQRYQIGCVQNQSFKPIFII